MMGHSGTVPSAILAEGVPAALERLRAALEEDGRAHEHQDATNNGEESPAIRLQGRAPPVLELFDAANAAKRNVI